MCDLEVTKFVMDFETALWGAIGTVLGKIRRTDCIFHWSQAVLRKVQELGLAVAYNSNPLTHRYIICLTFIPHQEIKKVFKHVASLARSRALVHLNEYIRHPWVDCKTFIPEEWSVYGQAIRTNNIVEGWHNALNHRAHGRVNMPFYTLTEYLYAEAKHVNLQTQLIADHKLRRIQHKQYRDLQARLASYWDQYLAEQKSVFQLLKTFSYLYGPVRELNHQQVVISQLMLMFRKS